MCFVRSEVGHFDEMNENTQAGDDGELLSTLHDIPQREKKDTGRPSQLYAPE